MRAGPGIVQAVVVACTLALASCGTTRIMTNDGSARIYVNGAYAGQGEAEMHRRGPPGTAEIVVEAPDGRRESRTVKRQFTGTTFALGLFTYMAGWLAAWEYPETVLIPLALPQQRPAASWDDGDGDVWLRPPPGWTPPGARTGPDAPPPGAPGQSADPWQ
jgi:hypothetical protein